MRPQVVRSQFGGTFGVWPTALRVPAYSGGPGRGRAGLWATRPVSLGELGALAVRTGIAHAPMQRQLPTLSYYAG